MPPSPRPFRCFLLACSLLLAHADGPLLAEDAADLVLLGGKIVTLDDDRAEVTALATRGDRVLAIGDDQQISALAGPATRVLKLNGQLVVPGFIEGHGHFVSLGASKRILDLTQATTWDQVVSQVEEAAKTAPAGQWIVGRGWHQDKLLTRPSPNLQGYPTHDAISKLTPRHPVMLTHRAGHMLLANAEAMRLAGVTEKTDDPAGGALLRHDDGRLAGVFRENAMTLIHRANQQSGRRLSANQAHEQLLESIRSASEECLKHGVTSFQDAGESFSTIDVVKDLASRGKLPVRLWVMLDGDNDALARHMADYRMVGFADHHLTVRGVKRLIDGALGTHGAWLLQPYDDLPASLGHNTTSLAYLKRSAELARQHDFQLCVHAIGDRANRKVLDLFEQSVGRKQLPQRRWRVEHAQHLHPDDIPRFKQLGVIASMQAIHATSDAPFVVARLGQRRAAQGAYAWRNLIDAGAVVINGSDTPVEPIRPLGGFYASVTRKTDEGVAFYPEQCMTRMEALRSYTRDAAFAAFEENLKGSLTPGKLADIVILSHDILTAPEKDLKKTRVQHTIVGGRILYSAEKRPPAKTEN